MIPEVALGEVATIVMGQSPPGSTYNTNGDGLPFFQGKAEFGEESPSPVKWCSAPQRVAEPGDVLLSVRAPVGPTNYASERCCIGRGLAAIRAVEGKADTHFIRYFLRSFEVSIARKGVGSTFTAINRSDIEQIRLPLPPLPEQKRIVRILDEAEELRRLRVEADRRTADLIPAIFYDMFGDPAARSSSWPRAKLGDICECRLGKMLDAKKQTGRSRRPYLRNVNVQWGRFDLTNILEMDFDDSEREEFRLRDGDLMICEGGEVGRCAIWRAELPECYFQKALHRARPKPDLAIPEYLLWLLRSLARAGGLSDFTTEATIAHLTGVKLKSMVVPLPPLPLQRTFAARVAEVRAMEAEQAQSRRRLDGLFGSLLHGAFEREL